MADVTAAGAKLYIGPANEDFAISDQTGYEGIPEGSWTEVGRVQRLGDIGDTGQTSTYNELNDRRTKTVATFKQGATFDATSTYAAGDAGQLQMLAALGKNHAYRIVLDDQPAAGTKPTSLYFTGMGTNSTLNLGDGTGVITRGFQVAINSDTIEDPAA